MWRQFQSVTISIYLYTKTLHFFLGGLFSCFFEHSCSSQWTLRFLRLFIRCESSVFSSTFKSSCLGRPTTSFFTFIKWEISHGLHSASFHCVSKICAIISSLLSSFKQTYLRFFTASCVQKFFFHLASLPKEFRIRDPCKRDVYNQNVLSQDLEVFPTPGFLCEFLFCFLFLTFVDSLQFELIQSSFWNSQCFSSCELYGARKLRFFNDTNCIGASFACRAERTSVLCNVFFWFVEARQKLHILWVLFCHL